MSQFLSRATVGVAGLLGAIVLVVWAVGFLLLGVHAGGWHLLVPVGLVLIIGQGVRRVAGRADDGD